MPREELYEEYEPQGFWSRMREKMFGPEQLPEEEEEVVLPTPGRPAIRLHSSRIVHVDVRRSAFSLDDARVSADGLKEGKQQVVNLEKTAPHTADRLVDFLSGVTYALDGTVERLGDKVYLFAPANVHIGLDDSAVPDSSPNATWGS